MNSLSGALPAPAPIPVSDASDTVGLCSTVDSSLAGGAEIAVEERAPDELGTLRPVLRETPRRDIRSSRAKTSVRVMAGTPLDCGGSGVIWGVDQTRVSVL